MTNVDEAPLQDIFFRLSGAGNSPWEIDRAQPVIIQLVEQGVFQGEVLDVGCGIGDNGIYIASHANNIHLTSIDLVPKAIEIAREKAEKNNVNIQFEVIDLLEDLSSTNLKKHSYDTILDAAVFHLFSNEDRERYIRNLEYLIKPGGLYIQLCLSEKELRKGGPRRVKKADLNELFSSTNGWKIESIEDVIYQLRPEGLLGGDNQAYLSLIRRNDTEDI